MKNKTKIFSLILATTLFLGLLSTSTSAPFIIEPIPLIPLLFHQPDASLSRSMTSTGILYPSGTHTAGDQVANLQIKCFLSFDISSIPAGATITSATLGLTDNTITLGNPFATLGNLRVYYVDYGTSLTVSDYNGPRLATVWSGSSAPSDVMDVKAELANAVASGKKNLQFRIEYTTPTDNDGAVDRITFNNPTLLYFYSSPSNKPDLRVTNIAKGASDIVVVTLANSGAGDFSGEVGLKIWFDGVTKFDGSGTVNMPAGSTATVNFPTLILPEGSTTVKATIDPANTISEENEANNERTQTLTVAASPTPTPSNNPPQANAGTNKTAKVGQSVSFNGSSSTDSDGTIISYAWDFGDGRSSAGSIVSHVYSSPGTYTVSLTVTDNSGATSTDTAIAIITEDSTTPTPPATTNKPPKADAGSDIKVKVGEAVHFDASKSTDSDGTITQYSWDFGDSRDSNEKEPLHSYATPGIYKVTLVVTDNNGATDQDVIYVTVEQESTSPIKGVPGFEVPGVLGAAALVYYYFRRRKN
ncbi:MAG: PKD domain-containing protein [Candidatus Methanofastidiosum sp.]|nr:PKD domain-containing protein [Methanofastidiosum sp.]